METFSIDDFPNLSFKNAHLIYEDTKCSCYYCRKTYLGKEIKEFIDNGETSICPKCSIDSVLPFEVDAETLKLAQKKYF